MTDRIRVLYSFPNKLGADRICYTAWEQVNGLAAAGADLTVFPGVLHRPVPKGVKVYPTLARGKFRIPYRVMGVMRACDLHDRIVARRVEKLADKLDIVHAWPLGALHTLKTASRLGIPTVLERPNANTRFAMEVVDEECKRLGVTLPPDHEHAYNQKKLEREEAEYEAASHLLCPSDFVVKTFLDKGYASNKLVRHLYGFDDKVYFPSGPPRDPKHGLRVLFVGVCAVRKGVHYALEAWLRSPAHKDGSFRIAGEFLPAYAEKLSHMLCHPSVRVLGHRNDVPELMRQSDVLVLPSIEEGFGLVITEAMGSGCVPVASDACSEVCKHMETGLVHSVGDVAALTDHFTMLREDNRLLSKLREASLKSARDLTWTAVGAKLERAYREAVSSYTKDRSAGGLPNPTRQTMVSSNG